ncbi:Transcription and mRNA export factor ENY2 [Leucoagaricus sp. SymC.cos]|nr:Transcription and mRNA export factor ENY2 [Leucoagaricus sp. SymC.cos]
MPAVETDVSLYAHLKRSLVESGEWDQLQAMMRERLNEAGWVDELKSESKEASRRVDFQSVLAQVIPHAQASLPMAVRKEVQGLIKRHIERKFQ